MANCRIICAAFGAFELQPGELPVLIDTLRAASTIVTALARGVRRILLLPEGRQPQDYDTRDLLTIGESGGRQLPGFEAGNSPAALVDILARNPRDTIVMKTSNLTRLLAGLDRAVICSSMNVQAVAAYCAGKDTCIIAAGGSRGQAEDLGVALALAAIMGGADFDPDALASCVRESEHARHLQSLGFQADIDYIAGSGQYAVVPVYDGSKIRKVNHP